MKLAMLLVPIIGFGVAMQIPEVRDAMMPALRGMLYYLDRTGDLITDLFVYIERQFSGAVNRA